MSAKSEAPRAPVTRLLEPRSVAIVGASPVPGSLGGGVLANLEAFGFAGDIYLINPRRTAIDARPCLASARELPMGVDCAVLAIPHDGVLDAVRDCAARAVGSVIIFAAGFAEAGPSGRAVQDEIAAVAHRHDMVVEGPNCLGMINFIDGVPLTFGTTEPAMLAGRSGVGILSQSGAMATVVRAALLAHDIGISFSISTGNEAVNGIEDFLDYLIDEPATQLITLVAEQIRRPQRFLASARRAASVCKPIVLLHPGRSAAARASAVTHTGAMTGDYQVMRTLVTHAGVVIVDTLEELIDVAELLARCRSLPQGGAAVVTDSGAFKALALDLCDDIGLALPQPSPAVAEVIDTIAPGLVLATNPVDVTAQALVDPDLYRRVMVALLAGVETGSLLLAPILSNPVMTRRKVTPIIEALKDLAPTKPVILAMLGEDAEVPQDLVAALRDLGAPFFRSPERALRALKHVTSFAARRDAKAPVVTAQSGIRLPRGVIGESEAKRLLAAAGIAVPSGECVSDLAAARQAAARIGYPVVLKAQSHALTHKSDAGGVVLNLADAQALDAGWQQLTTAIAATRPDLVLDRVLVEAMAPAGTELIVGARNEADWGAVLVIGLGGVFAEMLGDLRVVPADLDAADISEEFRKLRGAAILDGFRGAPPLDVAAAAEIAAKLGALIRAHPEIAEIDINPVVVYARGKGAIALDALIVTR
jgi:acyl-CoA synthetase (NDP forming)